METTRRTVLGAIAMSCACVMASGHACVSAAQNEFSRPPFFRLARNADRPNRRALIALNMICDVIGIDRTIRLYAAEITKENTLAFATTIRGTRYIVYDRRRVAWPEANIPWPSMLVMAHEVAHHAAGHNVRRDIPGLSEEIEADRFAGFALSRLGASETQALSFFRWDWPASSSHPSAAERREATRRGWQLGERLKRREARSD